jgi:hypothetical protein
MICLDALKSIANGPPYRDSSNQLIKVLHDISKVQAVPAILRLFKTANDDLLLCCLKTISALCVSMSFTICEKNQNMMPKINGLSSIIEICKRNDISNTLKVEAYYCLSMICLKNEAVSNDFFSHIDCEEFIRNIFYLLTANSYVLDTKVIEKDKKQSFKNKTIHKVEEIDEKQLFENINCQLKAGLVYCSFCYQNDEFFRQIILAIGRLDWKIYKVILQVLDKSLKTAVSEKNSEKYYRVQEMRCMFGFQVTILHNLFNHADEDPRAIGIKMMVRSFFSL